MEQYGEFTENINRLEGNHTKVRSVWKDQTADTYDTINDNMKSFTLQVKNHSDNSLRGYNMVKANYNEAQFDDELNHLSAQMAAV